ncbi:MAG: YHS domain-containing protein, partial [Pseudolabrys sp.]
MTTGHGHDCHHQHHESAADTTKTAVDPVCGMTVDPHATQHRHTHQGHPYYFCSAGCRTKFAADPEKYLGEREP